MLQWCHKHPSDWLALLSRFVWCKHDKTHVFASSQMLHEWRPKRSIWLIGAIVKICWARCARCMANTNEKYFFFPTQKFHTWRPFVLESNVNVICGFDRHLCETNWMCLQVWENCMEGLWRNISHWAAFSYLGTQIYINQLPQARAPFLKFST